MPLIAHSRSFFIPDAAASGSVPDPHTALDHVAIVLTSLAALALVAAVAYLGLVFRGAYRRRHASPSNDTTQATNDTTARPLVLLVVVAVLAQLTGMTLTCVCDELCSTHAVGGALP